LITLEPVKRWSQVLHIRSLGDCWICASFAARGDSQVTGYYKSALVTVDVRVISASLFATFFDLVLRSTSSTRTFLCGSFASCCIHDLETTPTSYTMTSRPSQDARVLSHGRGGAGKLLVYYWLHFHGCAYIMALETEYALGPGCITLKVYLCTDAYQVTSPKPILLPASCSHKTS